MQQVVNQGTSRQVPRVSIAYNFKLSDKSHQMFEPNADAIFKRDMTHHLRDLNDKMMNFLSVKHNALRRYTRQADFISWHNNANDFLVSI